MASLSQPIARPSRTASAAKSGWRLFSPPGTGAESASARDSARAIHESPASRFAAISSDNAASAVFWIEYADLAVSKIVNDDNPAEGQSITFTIALTNNGPDDVTGVEITDLLPAGVTYDSATPSQGSYNDGTGIWSVGSVASGAVATLTLTADVDPGTAGSHLTNTATITASSHDDPVPGNNSDSAAITVEGADVGVLKTVNNAAPNEGATIVYTILLTNNGPNTATGVEVSDLLPAGVTYSDNTPSQGAYDPVSGVWTVGTVNVSGSATLQIEAAVNAGTIDTAITNTASVRALDQVDFNTGNNTSRVAISVSGLKVTKESDAGASASPGDTITYTITITNLSSTTHKNVTVTDYVPTGTAYVADSVTVTVNPPVSPGGATSVTYNSSGSFVVPAGVTSVTVEVWGGGGGGGKAAATGNDAGGGGGGGGYARGSVAVTAGATQTVTVGAGGATATAGGQSWFGSATTVRAGGGGAGGTGASVGAGGAGTHGNQATFTGGSGGAGATGGAPSGRRGGGGGGSATSAANGSNGQAGTSGGAGGAGEGSGGQGNTGANNGGAGNAPGGGGGGGGYTGVGGAGAAGRVVVAYTLPSGAGTTNSPPNLASGWTLAPGSVMTVTFQVTVDNPCAETEIVNTVSVTSDQQPEPVEDTVTDPLEAADLAVTKTVDEASPSENDTITFTIVLTNK